jgi:transcriptional regulator GlxA family with amidase domain
MQIAIVVFDDMTGLDAIGPYEVLSRVPGAELTFVAEKPGPVRTDTGRLGLVADAAFGDLPHPDVVVVPGGFGQNNHRAGSPLHAWLQEVDEHTTWTTSVCTGSLVLAAAGLLTGRRATTHWLAYDELRALGAVPSEERVVVDGKYVTAGGVSSGIDMALSLAELLVGRETAQTIQLGIEYDPRPPFDSGSVRTAPPEAVEAIRRLKPFIV